MSAPNLVSASSVVAVDLFCGAGGLSLGLKNSGIAVVAGIDIDPACQYPYEHNIRAQFVHLDIAKVTGEQISVLFGPAPYRLLSGCAPCQPFSGYTAKRHAADGRWKLLADFLRVAEEIRPEIVTVENVPRLARFPLWETFVGSLEAAGYHVAWGIIDAAGFGVPQHRRRLVLLGSLLGPIALPPHVKPVATVREAIGDLAPVAAGVRPAHDALHAARALTPINLARIRSSRPAGTWREWPEKMRTLCHRGSRGRTYPSVYGRMSWDAPAPTITTQFYGYGNGRFGHPEQHRALTLREGAILQSFPEDFEFAPLGFRVNFRAIGRLIGNAVPPRLAEAIGTTI